MNENEIMERKKRGLTKYEKNKNCMYDGTKNK